MTATENTARHGESTPEVPLTWKSKPAWGAVGLSHYAGATINGEAWSFTVDQPSKGFWVARGWRDGKPAMLTEGKTLKSMKAAVQAQADFAATQTCAECKDIGGHTAVCPTQAIATATAVVVRIKNSMAAMVPAVRQASAAMTRLTRSYLLAATCGCPSPTHRMSCGVDSAPKVVSR